MLEETRESKATSCYVPSLSLACTQCRQWLVMVSQSWAEPVRPQPPEWNEIVANPTHRMCHREPALSPAPLIVQQACH